MLAALLASLASLSAAEVDFTRDLQPLLAAKCVRCHGPRKQEGGLRLDLRSRARQGGDTGPALSKTGELLRRVTSGDDKLRMPPGGKPLAASEIDRLKAWVEAGSPWPDAHAGEDPASVALGAKRPQTPGHWAFRPVRPVAPPAVSGRSWPRGPIDTFVLAGLEKEGITPSPEADPTTLLRRLHLDLTGLPPSVEEAESFARDRSPSAYERLVDRLLASPHFGERWGRHWLDLARYAESDGYENDRLRPDAWRWRDWVIDAFNRDLPYDRFTVEQLAGDLLPGAGVSQRVATGLHRNTLHNSAASADKEEFRTYAIKDRAETTAAAWLGLTLGCAGCHSHKYDPVSLREYYAFYAFFNATDPADVPVPGGKAPGLKAAPRETRVQLRGSYLRPGPAVEPAVPAFLPQMTVRGKRADRLDLARWLVIPDHPLTARVAVNHAWTHLFGAGLAATPENFGTSGEPPSHPDLLDWLAGEFVRHGWSRKRLIREIVVSSTYRQASVHRPDVRERDPDNRLLARQNRFRVEAEAVHDLALASAGLLRPVLGGPSFVPPFPRELPVEQLTSESLLRPTKERHRRAVYIHVQRTLTHPLLGAFDAADGNQPCARRGRSSTAVQSLTLLNDPTYVEAARALAQRVLREAPSDDRLRHAFLLTLSRPPRENERAVIADLLAAQRERGAVVRAAWAGVARVLLNLEEFTTRE